MTYWPDNRICDLLDIEHPIIQAPMAGAATPAMAATVSNAGGLGSLGCAGMTVNGIFAAAAETHAMSNRSLNLNFFCHQSPKMDVIKATAAQDLMKSWFDRLDVGVVPDVVESYYPFNADICDAVLEASPKVASFHFGLPDETLILRLKDEGIVILSSATSSAEAKWLVERGVDAVIAQGYEAGDIMVGFCQDMVPKLPGQWL
jgi:nitronate monooxygenase